MIFMPKRVPLKVSNKRTEKYIRKKLIQKIKINSRLYPAWWQNQQQEVFILQTYFWKGLQICLYVEILLEKAAAFLLQNASMLLQNATGITKYVDFITKRGRYYKTRRLLQNAAYYMNIVFQLYRKTN